MNSHHKILLFFTMVLCFVINHGLGIKAWCGRNVEGLDQEDKIIRAQPARVTKGGDPSQPLLEERTSDKVSTGFTSYFCCCVGSSEREQTSTVSFTAPKALFSAKDSQKERGRKSNSSKSSSQSNSIGERSSSSSHEKEALLRHKLRNSSHIGDDPEGKTKSHRSKKESSSRGVRNDVQSTSYPQRVKIDLRPHDEPIQRATGFNPLSLSSSYGETPNLRRQARDDASLGASSRQYVPERKLSYHERRHMEDDDQSSYGSSYRNSSTYATSDYASSESIPQKLDYNERRGYY